MIECMRGVYVLTKHSCLFVCLFFLNNFFTRQSRKKQQQQQQQKKKLAESFPVGSQVPAMALVLGVWVPRYLLGFWFQALLGVLVPRYLPWHLGIGLVLRYLELGRAVSRVPDSSRPQGIGEGCFQGA